MQVTGRTNKNFRAGREGDLGVNDGRCGESDGYGCSGDAAGKKRNDATIVVLRGIRCDVVRVQPGVELRADGEDREQQHERSRTGRDEAVEWAKCE